MCNLPFKKPIICLLVFRITGVELGVMSISVMRKWKNGRYETGVVHGTMPEDITTITPTNRGRNQDRQSRRPSKKCVRVELHMGCTSG